MHTPYIITRIIYNSDVSKKKADVWEDFRKRNWATILRAKKTIYLQTFFEDPKEYTSSWGVGHLFDVTIHALLHELFVVKWFYRCRMIRPLAHSCSATRPRHHFRMSAKSFHSGPLSFRPSYWSASSPCPPPWFSFVFSVFSSIQNKYMSQQHPTMFRYVEKLAYRAR